MAEIPGASFRAFSRTAWEASRAETLAAKASNKTPQESTSFLARTKETWASHRQQQRQAPTSSASSAKTPTTTAPATTKAPTPNASAAAKAPAATMHDRVRAFYEEFNPTKLTEVDAVVRKHMGREAELFEKLRAKYCPAPLPDLAPLTTEAHPTVYFDIAYHEQTHRVVMRLLDDVVPLAAENFRCLCTGEKGRGLHFKGSQFHRIIKNFMIQGGDITKGDGTGGASIYANTPHGNAWGHFKDERFLQHDRIGLLSLANKGKNTNTSQFFITTRAPLLHLNDKHVVFGQVIQGLDAVLAIEQATTTATGKPLPGHEAVIVDCGQL
ncbi:peptidylprolyl isomerase [Saprolegnia diclina VS20]|uniref:peptidylprolyl isomerase n=1 Tax=Saprolegnia diclina (strain VS20) TaxID=1156394 RepID=T0R6Z8_SAPDV|nr:peptidylprolyl isomerase [Saprolegnia diclina VS20]EQC27828.1 peptidylprolyl isomerase [Saprolegnia diclina VS20]|eukprot:XP_008618758.1 peptidylprolyl isomerase [Saprolegnia diclina VS20]